MARGRGRGRGRGEVNQGGRHENEEALTDTVQSILPDYGRGFIRACLEHHHFNVDLTVSNMLEGSLPFELATMDSTLEVQPQLQSQSGASMPGRDETSNARAPPSSSYSNQSQGLRSGADSYVPLTSAAPNKTQQQPSGKTKMGSSSTSSKPPGLSERRANNVRRSGRDRDRGRDRGRDRAPSNKQTRPDHSPETKGKGAPASKGKKNAKGVAEKKNQTQKKGSTRESSNPSKSSSSSSHHHSNRSGGSQSNKGRLDAVEPVLGELGDLSVSDVSTSYIRFQQQLGQFSLKEVSKTVPPNCTVLCVAEKPSLAQSIACFLAGGKGRLHSRRGFQEVHEFTAPFLGQQHCCFKVTSVIGHVYGLDFKLAKHKSWDIDPTELFDAPTERDEANPKAHICKHLKQEAKGCHYLILWLDCDREGENICFEVIENTRPFMKSGIRFNILRAKFSAITESAIQAAMKTLTLPNENEAMAVDARQELDLKVGVSFTRFQTRYFQGKYSNLDASVVSYGPCQTPTLGFCVERHLERTQHVPKPFWTVSVEGKHSGEIFSMSAGTGRMFDPKKAQRLKNVLSANGQAVVLSVEEKQGSTQRPTGLNTVNMLKMASTILGIGPHHAMQVAERLYMQGFLSYPRTESTGYPKGFDMDGTLYAQVYNRYWGNYVKGLLEQGYTAPRPGKDVGDHPPITPMSSATENDIGGGDSWRLYDLIARHFIASVSPDATHMSTKIVLESGGDGGERLTASGKRPLFAGFTAVLHYSSIQTSSVPALAKGDAVAFTDIEINQGETSPPGFLSESELIERMEKNGIGTDASIPTHINNICVRRYCNTDNSRCMVPTGLGIVLVQGYKLIDKDLVQPTVRSFIERQIDEIAKGTVSKQSVMQKSLAVFTEKFKNFVKEIEKMDALFEASFTNADNSRKIYTRCGKTMRYLKLIQSRPPKLYNPLTEEVYVMPLGGGIKQYKSLTCPLCNFELSLYTLGHKSYPLCPNCYCNPPQGMQEPERGVCTTCPMDDEHPIVKKLTVCECPESEGVLMVDPVGGPNWKLVSTRSPLIAQFPPGINKVTVLPETDEEGSHLIEIDFNPKCSSLPQDGSLKFKGGISDPFVEGLVTYKHGNERGQVGRRGRGRGRGRRRGRGRGRGKGGEDLKMTFWGF